MLTTPKPPPRIHLPKGWQGCVQSAVLHAIALAHYAIVYARAWAADRTKARVRFAAENDRLHEACALLSICMTMEPFLLQFIGASACAS